MRADDRWIIVASKRETAMPTCVLVIIAMVLGSCPDGINAPPAPRSLADLKALNADDLDRLFQDARPGGIPVGAARGQVLLMTDARFPKMRARMASALWKGKHFDQNGAFINQWPGFKALRGNAELGTSWHDGKPCLVLDYPPQTPVFGNTRDEMRQIAPGLYLARLYERCPCPRFRGYFAVQICACRHVRSFLRFRVADLALPSLLLR